MDKEIQSALQQLRAIKEELGSVSEDEEQPQVDENPFDYSQRVLFANIMEVKQMISERDKQSLICTNRRQVIELNASIYRNMKKIMQEYEELQEMMQDRKRFDQRNVNITINN